MQVALQLEKNVNQSLLDLHATADNHKDYQVSWTSYDISSGIYVMSDGALIENC